MIEVERYSPDRRTLWDQFVAESKNGIFLFQRDYMEYHADRFLDHSLLFFSRGALVGVMPANEAGGELVSHGGLTFGGVVTGRRMATPLMLEVFAALRSYLRQAGMGRLVYKVVPHIYHDVPAEEDLYALFHADARLVRRDVSSTIRMDSRLPLAKGRKSARSAARRYPLELARSADFESFMRLEAEHLRSRYGVDPVHTGAEMSLLASRFPDCIKLYTAHLHGDLVAGVVIYESRQVAHAQYIASSEAGRQACALDALLGFLLDDEFRDKRYFDFGISTERAGRHLNAGLIANKEGYGARATVHDFYELNPGG
jgi:hypothetical protein